MGRPMNPEPTAIQRAVLDFVKSHLRTEGRPPTQVEIAAHFGWASHTGVRCHLTALRRKGLIDRAAKKDARGIRLVGASVRGLSRQLPLLGAIPAGLPAEAIPESDEYLAVDCSEYLRPEELFALRVVGDSMIGAGIIEHDRLIVRRAVEADHGKIVAALLDGETTVKRLLIEMRGIVLRPENPVYNDIVVGEEQDFAVQGIVVGLSRLIE